MTLHTYYTTLNLVGSLMGNRWEAPSVLNCYLQPKLLPRLYYHPLKTKLNNKSWY